MWILIWDSLILSKDDPQIGVSLQMTPLISCQNISKSFGSKVLFEEISFGISKGDKIGLIGPNGSGKSTLLKILLGSEPSDKGTVARSRNLKMGYLPQEVDFPDINIIQVLMNALEKEDHLTEHDKELEATIMLSKMGFQDLDVSSSALSGGWKKRLGLAAELVKDPDLILLDEPTNHLDLEGVIWLEKFLKSSSLAYVVITHDRYFLEHTVSRMMELNKSYPKGLFLSDGSYSSFLQKREEFLVGQISQQDSLNSKVRREVEWLKQNPKARTTKSVSRIQEANRLIENLEELKERNRESKTQINFSSTKRDTRKLIVTNNLTKSLGGKQLFGGIDLTLSPGDRLGIVGLNGSGKTTFLKLLNGELQADMGTLKYADGVQIVYFDQHRVHIPPDTPLRKALSPQGDFVHYRGQTIHVNGWCKRFLFSPDRLDLPFKQLSGGEKARVYIAGLTTMNADVLLLDEPTNDLDIQTLEILEESIKNFPGAVVLISHDRYFLDSTSTFILSLGNQLENPFFADYRQWEAVFGDIATASDVSKTALKNEGKALPAKSNDKSKKLTYMEKKELDQMEKSIQLIEKEVLEVSTQLEKVSHLDTAKVNELCGILDEKNRLLEKLFSRWEELDSK